MNRTLFAVNCALLYVRLLCGRVLSRLRGTVRFLPKPGCKPGIAPVSTQPAEDAQASSAVLIFERRSGL